MDRVPDRRFGRFLDHLGQRRMRVNRPSNLVRRRLQRRWYYGFYWGLVALVEMF